MGARAGSPLILGELFNRLFSCFLRRPAARASCLFTLQFPARSSGQEGRRRSSEEDFFWRTSLWWGDPPVARAVEQESESSPLIQVLFGGGWCFHICPSTHVVLVPCALDFSLWWKSGCFSVLPQRQQVTEHISYCAEMHFLLSAAAVLFGIKRNI